MYFHNRWRQTECISNMSTMSFNNVKFLSMLLRFRRFIEGRGEGGGKYRHKVNMHFILRFRSLFKYCIHLQPTNWCLETVNDRNGFDKHNLRSLIRFGFRLSKNTRLLYSLSLFRVLFLGYVKANGFFFLYFFP